MMRDHAVISDIGGVLTPPPILAAARFVSHRGVELDEVVAAVRREIERTGRNPLEELELGRLDERGFLEIVAEALGDERAGRIPLADFSDTYFAELELNQPLLESLARLRADGARLAVLTNNAREWHERWLSLPEFAIFDVFVNSALEGVRKPDEAIYRLVLERLDLPAGVCTFIDDLAINCATARRVGMHAIVFTGNDDAIPKIEEAVRSTIGAERSARQ
jgi:putative hydrolase of the HAD superfamily